LSASPQAIPVIDAANTFAQRDASRRRFRPFRQAIDFQILAPDAAAGRVPGALETVELTRYDAGGRLTAGGRATGRLLNAVA